MAVYTTKENQTLLDVALQLTGGLDALVALAALNQLSPAATLPAGTAITYDQTNQSGSVARHLDLNSLFVVTASDMLQAPEAAVPTPSFTRLPFPKHVPAPNEYTAKANQSALDIALQLYGNLDSLVKICLQNGFTLSQAIPTDALLFDTARQTESTAAAYLALNGRAVVTWGGMAGADVAEAVGEYEHTEYSEGEYA